MHELTICQALLERIAEERDHRRFSAVRRVRLEIGCFSCLDPEALRYAFDICCRDTFIEGAALVIDRPPGRASCLDCGAVVEVESRLAVCPECGAARLQPTGGDGMRFIDMEVEG